MARTARNYHYVHHSNLKATRAARRAKARAYKKVYKLPKPMHILKRGGHSGRFSKNRGIGQPGFGWANRGPRNTHRYPVKKGPRIIKSKVMKRHVRKFFV